jgi:hypothetical protein
MLDDSRFRLVSGKCFYFEKEAKNYLDARENCKKKGGKLYEPKDVVALKKIAKIAVNSIVNRDAWIGILDSSTGHPGSVIEGTYVYDSNGQNIKFNLRRYVTSQQSSKCIQVYIPNNRLQGQVMREHCSRIRPSICELNFDRSVYPISTRGADYGRQITTRPPDFQTIQRPCIALFKVITENYIIFKLTSFEIDSNACIYLRWLQARASSQNLLKDFQNFQNIFHFSKTFKI